MAITIPASVKRPPLTATEARDYLQKETDSFGVFFDADRIWELVAILKRENYKKQLEVRRLTNDPMLSVDNKKSMISALIAMGINKAEFIGSGKSADLALNAGIIETITRTKYYSEEARRVAQIYSDVSSNKKNIGYLSGLATSGVSTFQLSKKEHRMVCHHPKWSILATSRLQATVPAVQSVPRTMSDIICEPKGYTLIRCDSSQIEPRINASAYLRDQLLINLTRAYDDSYFATLHYCQMSDAEMKACYEDFEHNFKKRERTQEFDDMRQNVKRLTNAGAYGSTNLDGINPALAAAYQRRIVNHPSRIALQHKVTDMVKRGERTFYAHFGTPVRPESNEKYTEGESGFTQHLIRCGINNPVQTTAAELMFFSIDAAKHILLEEAKDTHIAFYKHDEACFYVSDADMEAGIGDKLKDITAYNVEGWVNIPADAEVGIKKGSYPSYI